MLGANKKDKKAEEAKKAEEPKKDEAKAAPKKDEPKAEPKEAKDKKVEPKKGEAKDISFEDIKEIIPEANSYVEHPGEVLEKYADELQQAGLYDEAMKSGIHVMFRVLQPQDIIEEIYNNHKAKKKFR